MDFPNYFNSKNSLNLYGLEKDFNFLSNLYSTKKLPNVLMLSGSKGCGKSTLINHFLFSIFDSVNYDRDKLKISDSSKLLKQLKNNIFQNIIYLQGSDFKSIKVDNIRDLKSKILKSSIVDKERFIILDDVELFNINSLNALLKIIEEPSKKNYFILINNKTKFLIDTIKSRCLELKIILDENKRIEIITKLVNFYNLEKVLDPNQSKLTPGNYLRYNKILLDDKINIDDDLILNLKKLFKLNKLKKDVDYLNFAIYLVNQYYFNITRNSSKIDNINNKRINIIRKIHDSSKFNLNHTNLLVEIENYI